jgi:hypothetical protein
METQIVPQVAWAERIGNGIIVTFDDGKCGVYSAALLYATFSQAEQVMESEDEE